MLHLSIDKRKTLPFSGRAKCAECEDPAFSFHTNSHTDLVSGRLVLAAPENTDHRSACLCAERGTVTCLRQSHALGISLGQTEACTLFDTLYVESVLSYFLLSLASVTTFYAASDSPLAQGPAMSSALFSLLQVKGHFS